MWGQVRQMMRKGFLFQHSHRNMRCRLWFTVTQRQFTQSVGESRVGGKPIRGKEDEKWRDRSWITWNSALPSRNPGNKERNTDSGLCCVRFLCGSMDYSPPGSSVHRTSLVAQMVKNFCVQFRRPGFNLWVGKISWRREWQPTPVLLPGESHGQRSLARVQAMWLQRGGHDWARIRTKLDHV